MVALDWDSYAAGTKITKPARSGRASVIKPRSGSIAVTDQHGQVLAYVPTEMGTADASAHAALFAAAPELLALIRFASRHVNEHSHPGFLREFRARCESLVDRIDDAIDVA